MHAADVMDTAGDHARTVSGNDPAQIGHRQVRIMFGQQPGHVHLLQAVASRYGVKAGVAVDGEMGPALRRRSYRL
jgi:hypothetical protein